jgi:hypothetical protein
MVISSSQTLTPTTLAEERNSDLHEDVDAIRPARGLIYGSALGLAVWIVLGVAALAVF